MKKHHLGYLTLIVMALIYVTETYAGGWQWQSTKITQYVIEGSPDGDRIYVRFEPSLDTLNPDACTSPNVEWKRLYGNTEKGKMMFASVLSAKAASQSVYIGLDGCDDWGRPIIFGIVVQ